MDLGLKGRVALITGASRGIGRACALSLAAEGCRVAICARGSDRLEKTADEIRALGPAEVYARTADLRSAEDLQAFVEGAYSAFGRIDVLVAITGSPQRGAFSDISDEALLNAFESTVLALSRLVRLVLPHMRQARWGRVITVQSRSVRETIPDLFASNSTRPGAAGLMKNMARDFGGEGILFNTIVPGRIETDRFRAGVEQAAVGADEYMRMKLSDIPLQRLGEPEEIAAVVTFLASERASYINGAAIPVDGGVIRGI